MTLRAGEVHAVVGENGAGKTTLMNVLFGHLRPDRGTVRIDGSPMDFRNPGDAARAGIGMVHQHLLVFPRLTALENIIVGCEPGRWAPGRGATRHDIARRMETFGFQIPLDTMAEDLSFAHRQQIELLRVLLRGVRVIILDEPTSLLAPPEVQNLMEVLKALKARGLAVFFISHRIREVLELADRISVLRRGSNIATLHRRDATAESLARLMVGDGPDGVGIVKTDPPAFEDDVDVTARGQTAQPDTVEPTMPALTVTCSPGAPGSAEPIFDVGIGERCGERARLRFGLHVGQPADALFCEEDGVRHGPLLEVRDLACPPRGGEVGLDGISFQIGAGEALGIGGVVGNGQRALATILAGAAPAESGTVRFDGRDITASGVRERMQWGFRWLPANLAGEALLPRLSLWENLLLGHHRLPGWQMAGRLRKDAVKRWAGDLLQAAAVVHSSVEQPVASLSGGNQQKLVLSRLLDASARLLILEQPSRGLDFKARDRLHAAMDALLGEGAAVLLISHDLDELLRVSHRVGILYRGRLRGMVPVHEARRDQLGRWMTGGEGEDGT